MFTKLLIDIRYRQRHISEAEVKYILFYTNIECEYVNI